MAKGTVSLGGGIGDSGTSFFSSVNGDTDIMSAWVSPSTYLSGGYTSGTTASTSRPAAITNFRLRLGGAVTYNQVYYSGSADGNLQLSDQADGSGGYTTTFTGFNQTASTVTVDSGSISYLINGGNTYYYGADMSSGTGGTFNFARGGSGNVYKDGTATTAFVGSSMSGDLVYKTIPSKPTSISATNILQTTLTLSWTAPLDDGVQEPAAYSANNIKGYRISYKANSATTWSVLVANTGSTTLSRSITGLSPFTKYDFQVSALNSITNFYNSTYTSIDAVVGERSNILTLTTLSSSPKVYNGSAMVSTTTKVWDGSAWVGANVRVWDGTAWKQLVL